MKTRGAALIIVMFAVGLLGTALTWVFKPALLPGTEAHRAKKSVQATAQVQKATDQVDANVIKTGAAVAAGLTMIGEANAITLENHVIGTSPAVTLENPVKTYIGTEVPYLLKLLPDPSTEELLAAQKRKNAILEGRVDEAKKLYELASKKADALQKERDDALAARKAAEVRRQETDQALVEAAAADHVRSVQMMGLGIVAFLLLALWVYAKMYGVGPNVLGRIAADVRAGVNPIQALDTNLAPWMHPLVQKEARLATEPKESLHP